MDEITLSCVQRAVGGEKAAMEQIMRALERPFYNLALRMLLSPSEAEDATQECLLRVATRLAQFEGGSRSSTWAWKVAVNRILELRRRPLFTLEQFSADLADGLELEAPERTEDLVALGELKMGCGRAMLQCLEADDRIAYILGEILELEGPDAAEILVHPCGHVPQAAVAGARAAPRGAVRELRRREPGGAVPVPPPPRPGEGARPCEAGRRQHRRAARRRRAPGEALAHRRGDARRRLLPRRSHLEAEPRPVRAALHPFTSTRSN